MEPVFRASIKRMEGRMAVKRSFGGGVSASC